MLTLGLIAKLILVVWKKKSILFYDREILKLYCIDMLVDPQNERTINKIGKKLYEYLKKNEKKK